MNIRRTDSEVLRKLNKDSSSNGAGSSAPTDGENNDSELEQTLLVSRERCIPVTRGLMALLLSMDFTCNVDLFIVTCKVV